MRLLQWLRSWRPEPIPGELFVVCEKGEPIVVCLTEDGVSVVLADGPKVRARVFKVPVAIGGPS